MTASSESEPINAALEFHDSEVSSIEALAGGVQVRPCPDCHNAAKADLGGLSVA
jgi:hypothetical protein